MLSDETTVVVNKGKDAVDASEKPKGEESGDGERWPGDYNESGDDTSGQTGEDDDDEVTPNDGTKAMMSDPRGGGAEAQETGTQVKPPVQSGTGIANGPDDQDGGVMSIQTVPNPVSGSPTATNGSESPATPAGQTAPATAAATGCVRFDLGVVRPLNLPLTRYPPR